MSKSKEIKTVGSLLNGVEKLFLQVIIGLPAPILGLLAGWWGSISFVPEEAIKYFALGGLLFGILMDVLFLRRWVHKAYELPKTGFVLLYLFYTVGIFGFFMGVPVFNLIVGIVAGYYVGICLRHKNAEASTTEDYAHKTALFSAVVLIVVCALSLCMAFLDASLSANIQGLFSMEKSISKTTILALSGLGGILMVLLEYILTRAAVKFARFL